MRIFLPDTFPQRARLRVLRRQQRFGLHQFAGDGGAWQVGVYGGEPWVWVVVSWDN